MQDKVVIITGISKGLGKSLAQKLLKKGARVVGWGLNEPDYKHECLQFVHCDVTHEENVASAWKVTQKSMGSVDFLINNSGVGIFHPIEKMNSNDWHKMFQINLDGMMHCCREVVPAMKAQQSGHILNICSIAGRVGAPWGSGYNATKFGVAGFSESLFHELRKEGIKVTTVYPGSINTHFFDEIEGVTPHSNMLDPEEVARVVVELMDTSPNLLVREIEIRPLNSKPPKN